MGNIVPLDTELPCGTVAGFERRNGERYYFLVGGGVSYYPADVVEKEYEEIKIKEKQMKHDEFVKNVIDWAKARQIIPNSCATAQTGKTLEEVTELWQARVKENKSEIADAIGDIAVTLIIGNHLHMQKTQGIEDDIHISRHEPTSAGEYWREGCQRIINYTIENNHQHAFRELERLCKGQRMDFMVCCQLAWDEIKDRKGTLGGDGVFYKE